MAYLKPDFDCDVFVSYSHGGQVGEHAPLRDWTLKLVRLVEAGIGSVGSEFDDLLIWRDEQIDRTTPLTEGLRTKVKNSAFLMIVMSPRYLDSTWCKDELEWFRQQVQDRARSQSCVFVVRAMSTDPKQWPDFLLDTRGHALVGFQFHKKDSLFPYNYLDGKDDQDAYVRELLRLQTALIERMREWRRNTQRRANVEAPPADAPTIGQQRIYLHGRPEYAPVYDEVRNVLAKDGIDVLGVPSDPGQSLADVTRESRARMERAKRCKALALVRAGTDERFIGDLIDIGVDERERIQSDRGAPLRCAVLDRSGQTLPNDVASLAASRGIERFDLAANGNWRSQFHGWLNQ